MIRLARASRLAVKRVIRPESAPLRPAGPHAMPPALEPEAGDIAQYASVHDGWGRISERDSSEAALRP